MLSEKFEKKRLKIIDMLHRLSYLEFVLIMVVSIIVWMLLGCIAVFCKVLFVAFVCIMLYSLCLLLAYLAVYADVEIKDSDGNVVATVADIDTLEGYQDDYIILERNDGIWVLFGNFNAWIKPGYDLYLKSSDVAYSYIYNPNTSKWQQGACGPSLAFPCGHLKKVYCSTYDIVYTSDSSSSVASTVFFKAPKVGALQTVVKTINLGGVLSEIVSLMPLVLSVIILYLGLRKGLDFVSTHLRQA